MYFIIIIFVYLFLYGLSFDYSKRIPRVIVNSETVPFSPGKIMEFDKMLVGKLIHISVLRMFFFWMQNYFG